MGSIDALFVQLTKTRISAPFRHPMLNESFYKPLDTYHPFFQLIR